MRFPVELVALQPQTPVHAVKEELVVRNVFLELAVFVDRLIEDELKLNFWRHFAHSLKHHNPCVHETLQVAIPDRDPLEVIDIVYEIV